MRTTLKVTAQRSVVGGCISIALLIALTWPSAVSAKNPCRQIERYRGIARAAEQNYDHQVSAILDQILSTGRQEDAVRNAMQQARCGFSGASKSMCHELYARVNKLKARQAKLKREERRLEKKRTDAYNTRAKLVQRIDRLNCYGTRENEPPIDATTAIGIMNTMIGIGGVFGPGGQRGPSGGGMPGHHQHGFGGR
jgi:chromosome segregation ATPase